MKKERIGTSSKRDSTDINMVHVTGAFSHYAHVPLYLLILHCQVSGTMLTAKAKSCLHGISILHANALKNNRDQMRYIYNVQDKELSMKICNCHFHRSSETELS